jgi:hypothetical protein
MKIFPKDLFLTHGWRTGAILEEVEVSIGEFSNRKTNVLLLFQRMKLI